MYLVYIESKVPDPPENLPESVRRQREKPLVFPFFHLYLPETGHLPALQQHESCARSHQWLWSVSGRWWLHSAGCSSGGMVYRPWGRDTVAQERLLLQRHCSREISASHSQLLSGPAEYLMWRRKQNTKENMS